jgi:methionyl-tRNA synthetase
LPFDKDFVNYVWFDALTNYISFVGYDPAIAAFKDQPGEFRDKWPALQIVGKDILIPAHGIYWMIMLRALGFPDEAMPKFLVHGWWNISGAKISKSLGNIVDPAALADKYGADALRYYLMSEMASGKDADFSEERLVGRYNSKLANSLGNLLNRALVMVSKYRSGKLMQSSGRELIEIPGAPSFSIGDVIKDCVNAFDDSDISDAIEEATKLASRCDLFIDFAKPWRKAKSDASTDQAELEGTLYSCCEVLRIAAILISPVLPKAAHGIFDQLNWTMELSGQEERFSLADAEWGKLPDGHVVGEPTPLFPRIER